MNTANSYAGLIYEWAPLFVAVILEIIWYFARRKQLLYATSTRERNRIERKFRKYQSLLMLIFVLLPFWYFFVGNPFYKRIEDAGNANETHRIDSLEVDEFMEQYIEEKRSQEVED